MRKKKKNTGRWMIYSRYSLPLFSDLILIISMFIPCVKYVFDNEARDKISIFTLLQNLWNNSRYNLFSSQSSPTPDVEAFSQTAFTVIVISAILFVLAVAVDIFGLVTVIKEDKSSTPGKARILYSTLIPNRFVLCLLRLPVFPIILFPNIVELLYNKILLYPVTLNYNVLYPWVLTLALFAVQIAALIVSKKYERRLSLDILSKNILPVNVTPIADAQEDSVTESKIYRMHSNDSSDQNESIRRIFSSNDSNKE